MAKFQQNFTKFRTLPFILPTWQFFKSKYLLFLIVFADINFHHSIEGFNCYDFERNEYFIYEGVVLLKYSIKKSFCSYSEIYQVKAIAGISSAPENFEKA